MNWWLASAPRQSYWMQIAVTPPHKLLLSLLLLMVVEKEGDRQC